MTLSPELTLRGRYRPTQRIAVGGMGEVWQAEDTLLGRPVAIKMVRPEYVGDATFRDRFRSEARHAAVLTHPNVTQVFDFDEGGEADDEPPYIVMEYVDGQPLASLLRHNGRLTDQQTWSILGQTAAALAAAHSIGIVHRDVKTGNILVCQDGRVKVTDFGIARAVDDAGTTQTGFLMGTATYLAPELLRGESATAASDMYALGVVGYECLTGRPPFSGELADVIDAQQREQVPPLPETVSPALRDLVMSLLTKDVAARPTDATAVAAQAQRLGGVLDLVGTRSLAGHEPYPGEPTGPHTQVFDAGAIPSLEGLTEAPATPYDAPPRSRRGALIALGCLVGLAVIAAAVLLTIRMVSHGGGSPAATHSSAPAKVKPIKVANATVFAPGGAGGDHPEELPLATDASASSAWFTEHYATADFGSLKPGVGLLIQLPANANVDTVTVRFAQPGVAAKLYAGDNPSSLVQGKAQASTDSAPATWRVQLDQPMHAKYWLVWITKLVPDGGGYRAGIADLRFAG